MEKTRVIYESKSSNKMGEYQQLASELHKESQEIADTISDEMMVRCSAKSESSLKNCLSADCEYAAYAYCLEVEAWGKSINDRLENL